MKRVLSFSSVIVFILISCQPGGEHDANTFKDQRDGQVYRYVQIGGQVWMKENLRFKAEDGVYWSYNDDEARGDTMGYLYDYERACEVCPPGWHLPTTAEWDTLINYLGGKSEAGAYMKDTLSHRWTEIANSVSNNSGFTAFPEGVRRYDGRFSYFNKYAYFWSADTGRTLDEAWCYALDGPQTRIHKVSWDGDNGLSVRCIRD